LQNPSNPTGTAGADEPQVGFTVPQNIGKYADNQ
jgi:hypothetical protein